MKQLYYMILYNISYNIIMKVIPLGLQCSVPEGIKRANLREYSYPFDWLWCPSKTTYDILNVLINNGIDAAVNYMTTGYTYFKYLNNEHFVSVDYMTESQMNKNTGLGNTHFTINDEYKNKLRIRLERLLRDIKSTEKIIFVYADSANSYFNYYLDNIEYGVDATDYLLKINNLIYPINNNIKIVYFCWNERKCDNNVIEYIPYNFKNNWFEVSDVIKNYLIAQI
jgi:hypothetical protein